ncbi:MULTISPECIES: hypothetical protein [Pontibacter]|uniref:DUF3408 domain-containing protein n=2 Tax=Pseudomonadati TaxID=3379134 RepID=A0A501WSD0_9RHOB|nr:MULTISPECIES: hypothetical protein [Pontibacter]MBF8965541.1 hypothetical protein [Pontibacter sp. FD36]TPE41569.1 hypothetical protein FJM65_19420 [Pontibacter mangrovi]TPE48696.1 hypothetical protein FJM51_17220 [Amaricoccus solimangrovi]
MATAGNKGFDIKSFKQSIGQAPQQKNAEEKAVQPVPEEKEEMAPAVSKSGKKGEKPKASSTATAGKKQEAPSSKKTAAKASGKAASGLSFEQLLAELDSAKDEFTFTSKTVYVDVHIHEVLDLLKKKGGIKINVLASYLFAKFIEEHKEEIQRLRDRTDNKFLN